VSKITAIGGVRERLATQIGDVLNTFANSKIVPKKPVFSFGILKRIVEI